MTIDPIWATLLGAGGIITTIWRATSIMSRKIELAQRDGQEIKADIAEMKPKVDMILQHAVQLSEGKDRMDRIERRIDRIENGRPK